MDFRDLRDREGACYLLFLFGELPEEGAMFALQEPPFGRARCLKANALPHRERNFNDVY